MKRRSFIWASLSVALIPLGIYSWQYFEQDPLLYPVELSCFCDKKLLKAIGKSYLEHTPKEKSKIILRKLLLTDERGTRYTESNNSIIEKLINLQIINDFKNNNIVIIDGWLISITEARQCALLSITK